MVDNAGLVSNLAFRSVRSKAFEKAVLEVLIENNLTTKEDFEAKVSRIFDEISKTEFGEIKEISPEEVEGKFDVKK